jgi:hypothetical protein
VVSQKKYPAVLNIPPTTTAPFNAKSFIRNIFHLNPAFAIFCAEVVISQDPNSAEAKYLAQRYQISKGMDIDMPLRPSVKVCTHIKVTGVRCGSPALHGEQFCYFHQRMMRGVQVPPNARVHPVALIENEEAIQASLMEILNALARNTIDLRRAELMLRALHIAVKNARRVRFEFQQENMVREVPNFPAPPKPAPAVPAPTVTVKVAGIEAAPASPNTIDVIDPTQRKPAASAREAPKERKNAAHGESRG